MLYRVYEYLSGLSPMILSYLALLLYCPSMLVSLSRRLWQRSKRKSMAAGANNKQLISQLHKIDCLRFLRWYRCVAPLLWGGLVVYQGIEPGHITDSQLYILLGISAFCVLTLYRWQMLVWPELMETFELQTVAFLTTGNRIDYAR